MPIPEIFVAGDSYEFRVKLADYLPGDGWSLSYVIVNKDSDETISSAADGDEHVCSVTAAETATWSAGDYVMFGIVTDGTQRRTISKRNVCVQPDPTTGAIETRTHYEIVLDAIKALLENKADADQKAVTVDGELLTRYGWDELEKMREKYTGLVAKERRAATRTGALTPRKVRLRMQ